MDEMEASSSTTKHSVHLRIICYCVIIVDNIKYTKLKRLHTIIIVLLLYYLFVIQIIIINNLSSYSFLFFIFFFIII